MDNTVCFLKLAQKLFLTYNVIHLIWDFIIFTMGFADFNI